MQNVWLVISDDLSRRGCLRRGCSGSWWLSGRPVFLWDYLGYGRNESLLLGVFVNLVSHLSHNVIYLVPELNQKLIGEQTEILLHPDKL